MVKALFGVDLAELVQGFAASQGGKATNGDGGPAASIDASSTGTTGEGTTGPTGAGSSS